MAPLPSRLAIVTGESAPDLSEGGRRLAHALADRGIENDPVMWNDPSVEWGHYDAVLFRSCWDYPDDRDRFRSLLAELEEADLQVCNPLPVLRWNLHKRYLTELADAGVRIPPTTVVERGSDVELERVLDERGWEEVVVKPAVGAGSADVQRLTRADASTTSDAFESLRSEHDVVVQEFVPEITEGERSIVFFGGEYSHAWNSLTSEADVTAFDDHDATYEPPRGIRSQAGDVLQSARTLLGLDRPDLPYARVDYVSRDGALVLMELELIEPYLAFGRGEDTVERFTDALVSFFANRPGDGT